jgi:hypothetical protein
MADKDARVRLNLNAGGFVTLMRQLEKLAGELGDEIEGIGTAADKADKKVSPLVGTWKRGFGAAKSSLAELGSTLKSTLSQAATLGGALSFGAGVHRAAELVDSYKDVAFAVQLSTGEAHKWEQVQAEVEGASKRWKIANSELVGSYQELFKTTEDLEFTREALDSIGKAHRATGASVSSLTALANELGEKFGVTGDRIDGAMTTLIGSVPGGKAGLEELGDKLGLLGASARAVGLEGEEGLGKVMSMLNMAGATGGSFKKELMSVISLLETLGDADQAQNIEKKLGIKITDKSGATQANAIEKILQKTGGRHEELSKVFSGPLLRFVGEMGKTYEKTFSETAGSEEEKTRAATEAFRKAVTDAGKVSLTSADLQKAATERLNDPKARLQEAMNTFEAAFAKPEMISAIEKLADLMPRVADGAASLVEFIADNPLVAGAGFVAGKAGGSVAGSVAGDAGKALIEALKPRAKGVGDSIAGAASRHPGWATAGKAMGVAAAAVAGFEIGRAIVDSRLETKQANQDSVIMAGVGAHTAAASGDREKMLTARDNLKASIAKMKRDQGGIGGAFDTLMGGLATFVDPKFVAPEQKQLMTAQADLRKLEDALAKGAKGGEKAGDSMTRAAQAAERFAQALDRSRPGDAGGGNNGLPPPPTNQSGSAPR